MSWPALLGLCAVSYALKAAGPVLAGGRQLGPRVRAALDLVALRPLAALIVVQTLGAGHRLVLDARGAGACDRRRAGLAACAVPGCRARRRRHVSARARACVMATRRVRSVRQAVSGAGTLQYPSEPMLSATLLML
jgi:hypothetical protein